MTSGRSKGSAGPLCTWVLSLAVAACSAPPIAETPAVTLQTSAPCAPGGPGTPCPESSSSPPVADDAPCADGAPGPRCDGLIGAKEEKTFEDLIEGARQHVGRTAYKDARVVVELARLGLRRDADLPDSDGPSDAARALRNARQAIAVDLDAVEPRLVLALALARSVQDAPGASEPATRGLVLGLVDLALRAVPVAGGPAGAAAKALEGYVALDLGDRTRAREAFEYATQLDPKLATGWMGAGDLARAEGRFEAASAAYEQAVSLLPQDPGALRSLRAAARREALALPASAAGNWPAIATGSIAPAPPAPPVCPASAAGKPALSTLCRGLADLAQASTREDHEKAARLVAGGWNEAKPLCEARDAACGPHVAEAMAAASRAFRTAGHPTKSVAVAKLLLQRPDFPGVAAVAPALAVEMGDRYFEIGVFDQAAEQYAQHVRQKGAAAGPAADRAMRLFTALTNVDQATRLAGELAVDKKHPEARRAGWALLAARALRAVRGPEAAGSWLAQHRALLVAAGQEGAIAEISSPAPEKTAAPAGACASLLACAVRRLSGEARWSPLAGQIPPPKKRPKDAGRAP